MLMFFRYKIAILVAFLVAFIGSFINNKMNSNGGNVQDTVSNTPFLVNSATFSSEQKIDFGDFSFKGISEEYIELSNNNHTVEWTKPSKVIWFPVETKTRLHSGKWSLEFHVESMADRQIGIGFLLDWNISVDWGFFGYLGSSSSAWSYDPSTGDIVTRTASIHGNLPKFTNDSGLIGLELDLPSDAEGSFTFIIDGVRTPTKTLPVGAVAIPAVCLLKIGQKVTIRNLVRLN